MCLSLCLYLGLCIYRSFSLCLYLSLFVFVIICLFVLPHKSSKDSSKNVSKKAESNARDEVFPRAEVEEVQVEPGVIIVSLFGFVLYLFDCLLEILALRAKEEVEPLPLSF